MGAATTSGITVEDGRLLLETHVNPSDHAFWAKFWGPDARSDIWITLDPQFLRFLREKRPENLFTLMAKTTENLERLLQRRKSLESGQIEELTACVRILTRCLQTTNEDLEDKFGRDYLFYHKPAPPAGPPPSTTSPSQSVSNSQVDEKASGEGEAEVKESPKSDGKENMQNSKRRSTLAERIVSVITRLMFVPGFTLELATHVTTMADGTLKELSPMDYESSVEANRGPLNTYPNLLWEEGLESLPALNNTFNVDQEVSGGGGSNAGGSSRMNAEGYVEVTPPPIARVSIDSNRVVVLECLLACLGSALYTQPNLLAAKRNIWAELIVSPRNRLCGTLLMSLLNIITNFRTPSSSVYSYLTTFIDQRIELIDAALQVVLVLLDYRGGVPPSLPPPDEGRRATMKKGRRDRSRAEEKDIVEGENAGDDADDDNDDVDEQYHRHHDRKENEILRIFRDLTHPSQIQSLFAAICRLLSASQYTGSYFALDPLECFQECFVLLWKLLEENSAFLPVVMEKCDIIALVRPLLYFLYDCRNDSSKIGLLYSCVFILLRLSSERQFSVALNTEYKGDLNIPSLKFKQGTYADLMILVCQKVVVSSADHLNSMLNGVLTVISNCSPYLTSLSLLSSVKLLNLFELVTKPKFLYGSPHNPNYVVLMLDIFNNLIQYQYYGCPDLVYGIIRRSKTFFALTKMPELISAKQKQKSEGGGGEEKKKHKRAATEAVGNPTNTASTPPEGEATEAGGGGENANPLKENVADGAVEATAEAKRKQSEKTEDADIRLENSSSHVSDEKGYKGDDREAEEEEKEEEKDAKSNNAALALKKKLMKKNAKKKTKKKKTKKKKNGNKQKAAKIDHHPHFDNHMFTPTKAWIQQWQRRLPLETVLRLLDFLLPKFHAKLAEESLAYTDRLLDIVKKTTLVGVLPAPHQIVVHKYIPNPTTTSWFSTFLWGIVYLRNPSLYARDSIQLFPVFDLPENDEGFI